MPWNQRGGKPLPGPTITKFTDTFILYASSGFNLSIVWDLINSSSPGQNGRHFAADIISCIFVNEKGWILIKISLKFVPRCPINNIPALFQIMIWCRPGDKPYLNQCWTSSPTHICSTRGRWANWAEWILVASVGAILFNTLQGNQLYQIQMRIIIPSPKLNQDGSYTCNKSIKSNKPNYNFHMYHWSFSPSECIWWWYGISHHYILNMWSLCLSYTYGVDKYYHGLE